MAEPIKQEGASAISKFADSDIKRVGEGAADLDYDWSWENEMAPEGLAPETFEQLWNSRAFEVEEDVTGSLDAPSAGGTADFSGAGSGGLVKEAMKYIGTPYVWGGTSPLGFDCSGFTSYVYKNVLGITLPRVSYQQGQGGQAVSPDAMKPGDLVFWDNSSRNNGADHVGIYIGGGKFVSAPEPGQSVKVSSLYGNYWARRYTK